MKYELTEESKPAPSGGLVYRIRALKDFDTIYKPVQKGDLGGWIASERNLSQEGRCWVFEECMMYGESRRTEHSVGYGHSQQYGCSEQHGNSKQSGYSQQYGHSQQYGYSHQYEHSEQYGYSQQTGRSQQYGHSQQYGTSEQYGRSRQYDHSQQHGSSEQCGLSQQYGHSEQCEHSQQYGSSQQCGNSKQCYESEQDGTCVHSEGKHIGYWKSGELVDFIDLASFGAYQRTITYCKGIINVNNCFEGTLEEFKEAVDHKYKGEGSYYTLIKLLELYETVKKTKE